jgi:hypothetical protein
LPLALFLDSALEQKQQQPPDLAIVVVEEAPMPLGIEQMKMVTRIILTWTWSIDENNPRKSKEGDDRRWRWRWRWLWLLLEQFAGRRNKEHAQGNRHVGTALSSPRRRGPDPCMVESG